MKITLISVCRIKAVSFHVCVVCIQMIAHWTHMYTGNMKTQTQKKHLPSCVVPLPKSWWDRLNKGVTNTMSVYIPHFGQCYSCLRFICRLPCVSISNVNLTNTMSTYLFSKSQFLCDFDCIAF